MPPQGNQEPMAQGQAAGGDAAPCAKCGSLSTKKCSGCKRVRYCSEDCQSKHWRSDHRFKCKQMKKLDPGDKLPCGGEANSKKSSGFDSISLVPAHGKLNKVIFPYDEFLKLYNWKDLDFLPCGLVNCGNSCFANVVLQCLSCTRPLVAYLLGKDHSRECSRRHEDWCFLCELQCHIQRASESLHPFAPMNILSHLPSIGGNLGFGRQEDAHEFMRFAIDKMQSACLDEFGGEKAVDLSTQETTLIQHIFGGRLQSQVQCTACRMVSNRYDNMMDLTVEIQGDAESLEECLDQFTAVEWLDGDNKYKCDGCSDYVKARKHLTVHQAPNILTITLKRFQIWETEQESYIPMKLDLTPYMSTTDGSDLYDLYAVVVHLDMLNASFFGHYICYIKDCRGRWYRIDDCKVMIVDEEEVHAQGAYMLLYSRRTARPRPLIAVKEPVKQQQQCKVPPSNEHNHLIPEDAPLNCESFSKPSEDLQKDSESSNESLHKMDTMDRESDLDLHISIERDKFTTNKNLQLPVSSVSHVLEEATRGPGSPLEGSTTRSVQFDNSTCEASSIHSSAEQCEEPASCIDSADYMEVDTEAGTEVERWNEQQQPVLGDSIGVISNETSVPTLENGMTGKLKPLFSFGFLDKPSRKTSSFADKGQIGDNRAASSQKLNGHCNGHLSRSEQGVLANSCGGGTSSESAQCNGDMLATSSNGSYLPVNGDTQSSNGSLHADKRDVPFVSLGFSPRPYREPSGSNTNRNNTSNGKPLVDVHNKSFWNLPTKECKGDMSFLSRGFLERNKSVKGDDGTSSPFVNGNNKSSNNSSSRSSKGDKLFISPGLSTKHCRESAAMGTSASSLHDRKTSSNISTEQKSVGAAVLPGQIQETRRSSVGNVSGQPDENGHAILGTKNTRYGEENGIGGTLDMNGSSYQRDETSAMLVSEKGMGSENADHLKFISAALEHDGLRPRLTSKFPDQNCIDAQ